MPLLKWASPYHHASVLLAGIQPFVCSGLACVMERWMPAESKLADMTEPEIRGKVINMDNARNKTAKENSYQIA